MTGEIMGILAPIFVVTGLGWLWGRSSRPFEAGFVSDLALLLGAPAIAISGLLKSGVSLAAVAQMALAWTCCVAVMAVLGISALKLLRWPVRTSLPCVLFPNTGNVGLPLSMFAFGQEGLTLGVSLFAIGIVYNQSIAPWLYSGAGSLKPMLRLPALYATATALACLALDLTPPVWVMRTADLLAGCLVPTMVLALGVALSRMRVSELRRSLGLALLRLCFGYLVGVAVAWAFGMTGAARGVLIIQSSMPLAVFNYLFAQHFKSNPETVAGAVVLSTLISFATLPLLLWSVL